MTATQGDPMTALPLRDFTAAEQAKLDAIEAAPTAPESVTERVARELYRQWREESGGDPADLPEWERLNEEDCDDDEPDLRGEYRRRAASLIAVLRGPSSDAEQAVERVAKLAADYQATADRCREQAKRTHMIGSQHMWEQAADDHEGHARELRAALGGA